MTHYFLYHVYPFPAQRVTVVRVFVFLVAFLQLSPPITSATSVLCSEILLLININHISTINVDFDKNIDDMTLAMIIITERSSDPVDLPLKVL